MARGTSTANVRRVLESAAVKEAGATTALRKNVPLTWVLGGTFLAWGP
jgi:hypothetical protein